MSIVITSSANRFSINGVIFRDYINLEKIASIALCKDRHYQRFDILFYFSIGTKNASYTDETVLRAGPFPNDVLDKAGELVHRMLLERGKIFNLEEELLGKDAIAKLETEEERDFAKRAKVIAIETAKKMKEEGVPLDIISKTLGLSEVEIGL
jgi:hypothetical protein